MSDYDVVLDATADAAKKETAGKKPNEWDAERILEAAGAAGGAAACSAVGAAPLAPLCGWLGAKIGGFVSKVGERIGGFFKGVFGKKPPKPSLIKTTPEQAIATLNYSANTWIKGYANELVNVYWQDLGMGQPGEYGQRGALEDMRRIGGLQFLPRDVSRPDEWTKSESAPEGVSFPMPAPPDFEREFWDYAATLNLDKGGWDALSKTQKNGVLSDWLEIHMHPWMLKVQEVTAQVALVLAERAIAQEAAKAIEEARAQEPQPTPEQQALQQLTPQQQAQLRELAVIKALSPQEQAKLRELAKLKQLSPAEQESLRQLAALKQLSPTELEQLKAAAALEKFTPEERAKLPKAPAFRYGPYPHA